MPSDQAFEDLKRAIAQVDVLNRNPAVQDALALADAAQAKAPADFSKLNDVFGKLGSAVGKFSDERSTTADIASGICDVAGAVVKAFALAGASSGVLGPWAP
jgi:hypothetical protein